MTATATRRRPQTEKEKVEGDTRQPELKGMPAKPLSQRMAEHIAQVYEELEADKEKLEKRRQELMKQLEDEGREEVVCRSAAGFMYEFKVQGGETKLKMKRIGS